MKKQLYIVRMPHGYFGGEVRPLTDALPTIDAHIACWHILIGEKIMQCKQLGVLVGGKWDKMMDVSRRVYSTETIAPTLHTCGGG